MMFRVILVLLMMVSVQSHAADAQKPLTGKDLEMAVKMNDMYARHIYSSTCVETQKAYTYIGSVKPEDKPALFQSYKKSCDCMTDNLLKTFSPTDLIDFVTYTRGSYSPAIKNQIKPSQQQSQKFAKIMIANMNKETRKACGLAR